MRIKSSLSNAVTRALYASLGVDMITRVARSLIPGYVLHERMGYPASIPIANQDAGKQVSSDMIRGELFYDLVEALVNIDQNGYMGKRYPVVGMREIVKAVMAEGFVFDAASGRFYEDPRIHRTQNWGRLREGGEYPIALLRIDIAGNSELVRANGNAAVKSAYEGFRSIVTKTVDRRNGRIWSWEGDGGFAAFYYGHPNTDATLCGMEILHEIHLYNLLENPLDMPIQARAAAHAGLVRYSGDEAELARNEIVKEIAELEGRHTPVNSFTVSGNIAPHLDRAIRDRFAELETDDMGKLFEYRIGKGSRP